MREDNENGVGLSVKLGKITVRASERVIAWAIAGILFLVLILIATGNLGPLLARVIQ